MLKNIITRAGQAIHRAFEREETNRAGRASGWQVRQSKMEGFVFLKSLVVGFIKYPQASLNQLSQVVRDFGVAISPQGMDERINASTIRFLEERLAAILAQMEGKRQGIVESLDDFSEVYFQDSTVVSLPKGLREIFPGVGGNASEAALKIQLLFGFLSGQMIHWKIVSGRSADQAYVEHLAHLLPGSLLIQDLGYFCLTALQKITQVEAFFITRWRYDTLVYLDIDPDHAVDVLDFLALQGPNVASYDVHVGDQVRLPVRMICVRLPAPIAATRRRRARQDAQRKGRSVSERTLAFCDWNIFLTNLPPERLSLRQLLVCYSLRWQIELIFKLWKSQAALDHLAGFRLERILAELYAKLIGLVLTHFIVAPLRFLLIEQLIEISPPKARQILQDRIASFSISIGIDQSALEDSLDDLFNRILSFARKNRRKKHLSSIHRLRLADQLDLSQLYPLA